MTGKNLFHSCIKHADLVPNRRVFEYDADKPNESNDNASNADGEQVPDRGNSNGGNTIPEIVHGPPTNPMAVLDADDLIGRTYLTEHDNDGNQTRMWIVELYDHDDHERMRNPFSSPFQVSQ